MKPFDLEATKRGEPIVCRDGTPAKFIAHVPEAMASQQVVVLVGDIVSTRPANGTVSGTPHDYMNDLFMATRKREGWVNVAKFSATGSSYAALCSHVYATEDLAKEAAHPSNITVRIEWEE